jgi:hypothetical protein
MNLQGDRLVPQPCLFAVSRSCCFLSAG